MHRLSVLGSLSLRGDGTAEPQGLLSQPKRLGVLLYLALARPHGAHQRDTLLALFWPELDTARARNALSQTLHHLRRALGADSIRNRGSELLELDRVHLQCDAVSFIQLVQQRRWAEALAAYGGELLPGFHLAETPEFERWLADEREHLRQQARLAAASLAAESEAGGDLAGAVEAWRRALELSPDDEAVLRRLMTSLANRGDRAGAVRVYESFCRRLASELGLEPSAETRAQARALSARPAEPRAPEPSVVAVSEVVERPAAPAGISPTGGPTRRRGWRLVVPALTGLTLLVLLPLIRVARESRTPLDPRLVVVAPFRLAEPDSGLDFLREGVVDLFASRLAGGVLLAAEPRAVLTAWDQTRRGRAADEVSNGEARQVARRLGAAHLLLGTIIGPAERPTFSGRLIAVADGKVQTAAEVTGSLDSLPDLIDRLAGQLLAGISSEPRERLADLTSASFPALERYLVARDAYRHGDYASATSALRSAVALDSTFALAWLHLADAADWTGEPGAAEIRNRAWALRSHLTPGDRAYLEALLGPRFPEPPSAQEQRAAWERVVALTPDRVEGWYGLGDVLFHHGTFLEADSGFQAARAAFSRAVALDAGYAAPLAHLVQIALLSRDLPGVQRLADAYWALDSTGDVAEYLRWHVAIVLGDSAGLREVREAFSRISPPALRRIITWSQLEGVGVGDGLAALGQLQARAATAGQRQNAMAVGLAPLGNSGQLEAFLAELERHGDVATPAAGSLLRLRIVQQYSVDPATVDSLAARIPTVPGSPERAEVDRIVALSHLLAGRSIQPDLINRAMEGTRRWPQRDPGFEAARALLTAACCPLQARPVLDSVSAELPSMVGAQASALIDLALAYERIGEPGLALRTLRRRSLDHWLGLPRLAPAMWLEGRLAAETGDTAAAVHAWKHYLALRAAPDPAMRGEVDGVREALARLEAKSGIRRP
jgi:DNA-binding SARP family transcriptional activator